MRQPTSRAPRLWARRRGTFHRCRPPRQVSADRFQCFLRYGKKQDSALSPVVSPPDPPAACQVYRLTAERAQRLGKVNLPIAPAVPAIVVELQPLEEQMQPAAHGLGCGAAQFACTFHKLCLVDRDDLRDVDYAGLREVGLSLF